MRPKRVGVILSLGVSLLSAGCQGKPGWAGPGGDRPAGGPPAHDAAVTGVREVENG